jgi:hypothetical protein
MRNEDNEIVSHTIYVQSGDARSNELTLKLLRFIKMNLSTFKKMNVIFTVQKFSVDDLKQSYVTKLLKSKGVERLPALVTRNKVYHGSDYIIDNYQQTILSFKRKGRGSGGRSRSGRQQRAKRPPRNEEDLVDNYMQHHMLNRDDEEDIVENSRRSLEDNYMEAMGRRREAFAEERKRPSPLDNLRDDFDDLEDDPVEIRPRSRGLDNIMDDDYHFEYEQDGSKDDAIIGKYLDNQETTF